jgi:hypothetical protein
MHRVRYQDAAWHRQGFQPGGDVDAIAEDVVVVVLTYSKSGSKFVRVFLAIGTAVYSGRGLWHCKAFSAVFCRMGRDVAIMAPQLPLLAATRKGCGFVNVTSKACVYIGFGYLRAGYWSAL